MVGPLRGFDVVQESSIGHCTEERSYRGGEFRGAPCVAAWQCPLPSGHECLDHFCPLGAAKVFQGWPQILQRVADGTVGPVENAVVAALPAHVAGVKVCVYQSFRNPAGLKRREAAGQPVD